MPQITSPEVAAYLTQQASSQHGSDVLDAMEARAAEHHFPIVGRAVGRFLETAARSIGARRVMELGSGYGYSAYWFAQAVGPEGEVVCTDADPANAALAEGYLTEAGLWGRVRYRVGDALEGLEAEEGRFDIVYCDVDKGGYPDCWRAARWRVRLGGLYVCDNVLWSGLVVSGEDRPGLDGWTAAIQEHNELIATDQHWSSSIVPIRDGVLMALKIS